MESSGRLRRNGITGEAPLVAASMGHCMILAVLLQLQCTDEWEQIGQSDKKIQVAVSQLDT